MICMIYFSLTPHIYAARYEKSIIILNARSDNYLSLIDSAAEYLSFILEHSFNYDAEKNWYSNSECTDLDQLNYWIDYFTELAFIKESTSSDTKKIAPQPLKPGGLHEYQWDTKTSWQPFKNARRWDITKAFCLLIKIHWLMKRRGIGGILYHIEKLSKKKKSIPSELEIQKLANAIDAASLIYPKKTYCLAWAATFVIIARKKGWDSNLVIGIQSHPFYAHAWVEIDGKVIHDDPTIAEVLSIILKTT